MTRWAFLGAGAMAGAMVRGLLAAGATKPESIVCIGGNDPTAANLSRDETPMTSLTTELSFRLASSKTLCTRLTSRLRS